MQNSNMSDSTSWGSIAIPRKSTAPYFPDPVQHLPKSTTPYFPDSGQHLPKSTAPYFPDSSVQHLPIGIRPSLTFPHGNLLSQLPHRSANLCGGSSLVRNLASPLMGTLKPVRNLTSPFMGTLKPVSCPVPPEIYSVNALPSDMTSLTVLHNSSTTQTASPSSLDPHPCAMSTPVLGHPMASDPYCGQVVSVTLNSTESGTIRFKGRKKALVGTNLASSFFPPDSLPRGRGAR